MMSSAAYNRHKGAHEALSYIKPIHELSTCDKQWLEALSHGAHAKHLSDTLSEQQIKNRLQAIRQFMNVGTTTHAVAKALRDGVIK
jgi:hypothetical protein